MIGRLTSPSAGAGLPEAGPQDIDPVPVRINRPHRIIAIDIILDPGRKETRLTPADAGPEAVAIRHTRIVQPATKSAIKSCPVSKRNPSFLAAS